MITNSYTGQPVGLPEVAERFLRYVQIDSTADPTSSSVPSSAGQLKLAHVLVKELLAMGIGDAEVDDHGYVYAHLPGNHSSSPAIALLAHLDTSPDAPGANVRPLIHRDYDGSVITFALNPAARLDPAERPELLDHVGHDLITSDGTTLLGSDDKAGVALIMQLAQDLQREPWPHPALSICFTVDEEIGRGVDHLDFERLCAEVAYTIDGSGRDTLYCETFNAAEATVRIEGRMVHPGYARGRMINALRIASDFISALPRGEAPETTSGRSGYIHPHTMPVARVDVAEIQLLLRDFEDDGLDNQEALVRKVANDVEAAYPGSSVHVEIRDRYRNMKRYIEDIDSRVRTFALEAAREAGIVMNERPVRGGTDGARLSELGLPTPNVFNGGHDYHSVLEWNSVQNLEHALTYLKALLRYWARHGSSQQTSNG